MAKVKVDITADGSGFHRVMGGIGSAVTGLKAKLAAAFSIGTIGYLAKQILDFGDSIQAMADNFDISTDSAQRFAWAARNANIQIATLEKGMIGLDTAMRKALGGDTKTKGILAQLGITDKDLGSLNKENALIKVLQTAKDQGFSDNKTAGLLGQLGIQPRVANRIVGASGDILNKNIPIVSENTIKRLDALGDAFTNVKNILIQALMPALLALAKAFVDFSTSVFGKVNQRKSLDTAFKNVNKAKGKDFINTGFEGLMNPTQKELYKKYIDDLAKEGLAPRLNNSMFQVGPAIKTPLGYKDVTNLKETGTGVLTQGFNDIPESKRDIAEKIVNDYLNSLFGPDTATLLKNEMQKDTGLISSLNKVLTDLQSILSPRPGDPDFIGPVQPKPEVGYTREPIAPKAEKYNQPGELSTSNEFMKIGGALGANLQYRVERLQLLQAEYMRRTADATEGILDKMDDGQDYSPT